MLLQACDREGKPETLSELLVGMPQLGCEPTLVNYNTAIRGLARAGEQRQVRHVIDNVMVEAGVPPAISTFRAAINGSCAGGHTDDAVASRPRCADTRAAQLPSRHLSEHRGGCRAGPLRLLVHGTRCPAGGTPR